MDKNKHLAPSILSADFMCLGDEIRAVKEAGADVLHFDVMDGLFVPSISFGMPVLKSVRQKTDLFLDVHLMIQEPERYIEEFAKSGADLISFHYESTKDPEVVLKQIKACGKKTGLAIKPATDENIIKDLLPLTDLLVMMTVEPGFGGQACIPECVEKIRRIRPWIDAQGLDCAIEADGGVKKENIREIAEAGADWLVAGSAVFKNDTKKNAEELLELLK